MTKFSDSIANKHFSAGPGENRAFFKWEDDPFVITVDVANSSNGYLADLWVTGIPRREFHEPSSQGHPAAMLRIQIGISRKQSVGILENELHYLWNETLLDLSMGSAIQNGIVFPRSSGLSRIEHWQQHAWHHLEGHTNLGHFSNEESSSPLIERTAKQYGLLKSLGVTQTQKLIADFESDNQNQNISLAAIDRRLFQGRQLNLIQKKNDQLPAFFRK